MALHPPPPWWRAPKHFPRALRELVRLAVPAAEQVDEDIVGQFGDRHFGSRRHDRIRRARIEDDPVTAYRRLADGRHEPAADIAEAVDVSADGDAVRSDRKGILAADIAAAFGVHVEEANERRCLRHGNPQFVTEANEHGRPFAERSSAKKRADAVLVASLDLRQRAHVRTCSAGTQDAIVGKISRKSRARRRA